MDTPVFQQLTGLVAYVRAQLRADSYLVTGEGETDLGYKADQVCKGATTHKMFEVQGADIAMYVELGKLNFPALAIYVDAAEYTSDDGGISQECQLGIQYLWESSIRDITTQAYSAHLSMAIWMAICEIITDDMQAKKVDSTLKGTYHIEDIGLDTMRLLPPLDERVRAFEASGSMLFKRPMWDTGDPSHKAVVLASVYTDYEETGPTGADPLVQSIHKP